MKTISLNGTWNMQGNGFDCNGTVPGSVYSFLLSAGQMPDPYYRQNELEATELLEYDYTFSRKFSFDVTQLNPVHPVCLCCDGLDTVCDIYLNGEAVGHTENMHRSYKFDITALLRADNELSLIFRSPKRYLREAYARNPSCGNSRNTLNGYSHLRKSFCMSGWDWGPRLPDAGIGAVFIFGSRIPITFVMYVCCNTTKTDGYLSRRRLQQRVQRLRCGCF